MLWNLHLNKSFCRRNQTNVVNCIFLENTLSFMSNNDITLNFSQIFLGRNSKCKSKFLQKENSETEEISEAWMILFSWKISLFYSHVSAFLDIHYKEFKKRNLQKMKDFQ